jgi:crotonobetainyl-CoA:carnitine CoA-transferase CaiB-like acyl-CoA transferase
LPKQLKVIELAGVLAGPSVGMFFAELGAKVIKVENPLSNGDVTRNWKLPNEENAISAYYASVNCGKEIVWLNLMLQSDREKLYELVKTADIVITNYKKGDDKKLGVNWKTLRKINKKLIYASISGFSSNPDKTAFDVVLQAETGFMSMTGEPNGKPVKMPVALIDILAAHQLKEGILLALLNREKTKKGAKVEISLEKAALASLANQATNYLMVNHIATPMGSAHPNIAPYGDLFTTNDNKNLVLAVGSNKQFENLCLLLNMEDLLQNPKFSDNMSRVNCRSELVEILQEKIGLLNADKFCTSLKLMKIPYGLVRNMGEVLSTPTAKEMTWESEIEGQPVKTLKTVAFNLKKL